MTVCMVKGRLRLDERLYVSARPRHVMGHREFAESRVRLGSGPRKGERFRVADQPLTGLLLDEFDNPRWNEIFITGPSQSSKSLCGFVIPTLRDISELRLDALCGCPEADMMSDKWDKDFLPVMNASPDLQPLIPTKGPGSKGGRIKDRITFTNGVDLKVMTVGGRDTNKAGFSSPRLRLTEAAGWSKKSENSVEGGAFRQVKARLRAFKRDDPRRCMTVEGTMTVPEELPAVARGSDDDEEVISTRSTIQGPCPHCREFIHPIRDHLVGWQDALTESEVKEHASWFCYKCGGTIDDDQRAAMMQHCRLVHFGQHVDTESGDVLGETPETSTLWFQWGSFHNLLLGAADIALDEFEAKRIDEGTQERENANKALCQFVHGVTFKSTLTENEPLDNKKIAKRAVVYKKNVIPADTLKLSIGVDIGDWFGWWFAIAFRANGVYHVPAYGKFNIKRNKSEDLSTRIRAALYKFSEDVVEPGFPMEGSVKPRVPDKVWIDGGYMPEDVAKAVRKLGPFRHNRYRKVIGRGRSVVNTSYAHRSKVSSSTVMFGNQWYGEPNYIRKIPEIVFNADYWKLHVDERLRADEGKRGSMVFYAPDGQSAAKEHALVARHLSNEQFVKEWKIDKGIVEHWKKTGDQHLKDAAAMACGAGDEAGFSLTEIPVDVPELFNETEIQATLEDAAVEIRPEPSEVSNFYAQQLGRMRQCN